jgi:hypothetical protein
MNPDEQTSRGRFLKQLGALVAGGAGLGMLTSSRAFGASPDSPITTYTCCPTTDCTWECNRQGHNYGNRCTAAGCLAYCVCLDSYRPCYSFSGPSC